MDFNLKKLLSPPRTLLQIDGFYDRYCEIGDRLEGFVRKGEPIYERDWDVLILLDGCRLDLMKDVEKEYTFLDKPGSHTSVGSTSEQWISRNFTEEYIDEMKSTIHITGNPYTEQLLSRHNFRTLDEVWRYGWDDELGTLPPRRITDRAISQLRNVSFERSIIHYMQPHYPFIPQSMGEKIYLDSFGVSTDNTVWDLLRKGSVDTESVWNAYRKNLQYVLDEVELLIKNITADNVVISADHGNALGEFGQYGHRQWLPIHCHREVPWYRTSAKDINEYTPSFQKEHQNTDNIEKKLSDLGYK